MALFHVHASVISKGKIVGGSAGFAQYIAREQPEQGAKHAQYIARESHPARDDLIEKGHGALPVWARSGSHFFAMADRYERTNALVARCYEIALPRELTSTARLALAADIRATFFAHFPHAYAIHNPVDAQGLEHPHMHLMLSERRVLDGIARSPKMYFARAAEREQDQATHGVRKDRSLYGVAQLRAMRAGIATLTNAALEREGHAIAISHQSHQANGFDREAAIYPRWGERDIVAKVQTQREILHRDWHQLENEANRDAWSQQKHQQGIYDLSREAIIDHVRDQFFIRDKSPARERERAASFERQVEREYALTGRDRTPTNAFSLRQEPTKARELQRMRAQGLNLDEQMHGGIQVSLDPYEWEITR
jgi:hypothetical protein